MNNPARLPCQESEGVEWQAGRPAGRRKVINDKFFGNKMGGVPTFLVFKAGDSVGVPSRSQCSAAKEVRSKRGRFGFMISSPDQDSELIQGASANLYCSRQFQTRDFLVKKVI